MKRSVQLIILALWISSFTATVYAAAFQDSLFFNNLTVRIKTKEGKKITGELLRMGNDSISVLYYIRQLKKSRKTVVSTCSYKDLNLIKVKVSSFPLFITSLVLIALSTLIFAIFFTGSDPIPEGSGSVLIYLIAGFIVGIGLLIFSIKSIFKKKKFKIDGKKEKYESSRLKLLEFKI